VPLAVLSRVLFQMPRLYNVHFKRTTREISDQTQATWPQATWPTGNMATGNMATGNMANRQHGQQATWPTGIGKTALGCLTPRRTLFIVYSDSRGKIMVWVLRRVVILTLRSEKYGIPCEN
jgi:hypothetical protein